MQSPSVNLEERRTIVSVVEDDAAMGAALRDLLNSAGCEAIVFERGESFIRSGAASNCDVIITDIELAGFDGLQILGAEAIGKVPVIVITALTDHFLERRAVDRGCFAFLRKPFDPAILLEHVRQAAASR
ncbi:response regulator [Rhizobium halophilum]|uniref:response regulator n=1 Tax=Rhizobium halophilum TaxID=2846852 RepID=UPI001EFD6CC8|nr:response regulator [Rhizobium halophilum]MCF6371355.1 response regulator [Rhizobium halophilum]